MYIYGGFNLFETYHLMSSKVLNIFNNYTVIVFLLFFLAVAWLDFSNLILL